jgi:hypothetical protein
MVLDYAVFPLQETIVWTNENGNNLGTFDIPIDLSLIFLKDGYQVKIILVTFHTDQPTQMSVVLKKSP